MPRRSIIFWNLERLFEAGGSPIHAVISGNQHRRISQEQIDDKINTIGAVLNRVSELIGPPVFVGFTEIQTTRLANRIARTVPNLKLTHVDGQAQDQFGAALDAINISLLYAKDLFTGVNKLRSHIVDRTFETRDILEVELQRGNDTPITVFVNHWPSRLAAEGASKRITAAYYLRYLIAMVVRFSLVDLWNQERQSLEIPKKNELLNRARKPVVVMGDFNDQPYDASIGILRTTLDLDSVSNDLKVRGRSRVDRFRSYIASVPYLANPFWKFTSGESGSYYRSPRWRTYDQIMFSRGLIEGQQQSIHYTDSDPMIFSERSVIGGDGREVKLTNRNGKPISYDPETRNGCSDHFPIAIGVNVE